MLVYKKTTTTTGKLLLRTVTVKPIQKLSSSFIQTYAIQQ